MEQKYTFFWRGKFSQWAKSIFEVNSIVYSCAEKFMMANKALLFKDYEIYGQIMANDNPKDHQELGRKVKNFNLDIWNSVARSIVYVGNYAKFTQNNDLLDLLLKTKGTTLVEASPIDPVWGVKLAEDNPLIKDSKNWKGKNWLGQVLTQVRDDIIDEENFACQKCLIYDCEAFPTLFDNSINEINWNICKRK